MIDPIPHDPFSFEVIPAAALTAAQREAILRLCSSAYEEPFEPYLDLLHEPTHLLLHVGELVSHAAWVTRWLRVGEGPPLRTAYVEAVATAPSHQGMGYGSAVMRRVVEELGDYDLAALSPATVEFYERLGWERWRGPLAIRTEMGLEPSPPDEEVMIHRLPRTPRLDLTQPLSAEWRPGELW